MCQGQGLQALHHAGLFIIIYLLFIYEQRRAAVSEEERVWNDEEQAW